jgi:serine/threonine protein kinase
MSRVGQVICGYNLEKPLATGGFGTIYLARQADSNRKVVIKVMHEEYTMQPEMMQQLENEARILTNLQHNHIVPFYDFWRDLNGCYLAMRWLKGGNLRQYAKRNPLTLPDIARILKQVASALDYAHQHNIIHRDIKPDNILLDEFGNAFLADFGIAVDLNNGHVQPENQVLLGSPTYIAPEQLIDKIFVPQGDIYSLGIMLFELLTHEQPFKAGTTQQLLLMQVFDTLPLLPAQLDLPVELNLILRKATEKQPEHRYSSALEMALEFEAVVHDFMQTCYNDPDMTATQEMMATRMLA